MMLNIDAIMISLECSSTSIKSRNNNTVIVRYLDYSSKVFTTFSFIYVDLLEH